MTAIHDLTTSPYFHVIRRPPTVQAVAVPLSPIARQALDFWQASRSVRERRTFRSMVYGARVGAEATLWRLRYQGFVPTLRDRARQALQENGCLISMTPGPGPFGGSAA